MEEFTIIGSARRDPLLDGSFFSSIKQRSGPPADPPMGSRSVPPSMRLGTLSPEQVHYPSSASPSVGTIGRFPTSRATTMGMSVAVSAEKAAEIRARFETVVRRSGITGTQVFGSLPRPGWESQPLAVRSSAMLPPPARHPTGGLVPTGHMLAYPGSWQDFAPTSSPVQSIRWEDLYGPAAHSPPRLENTCHISGHSSPEEASGKLISFPEGYEPGPSNASVSVPVSSLALSELASSPTLQLPPPSESIPIDAGPITGAVSPSSGREGGSQQRHRNDRSSVSPPQIASTPATTPRSVTRSQRDPPEGVHSSHEKHSLPAAPPVEVAVSEAAGNTADVLPSASAVLKAIKPSARRTVPLAENPHGASDASTLHALSPLGVEASVVIGHSPSLELGKGIRASVAKPRRTPRRSSIGKKQLGGTVPVPEEPVSLSYPEPESSSDLRLPGERGPAVKSRGGVKTPPSLRRSNVLLTVQGGNTNEPIAGVAGGDSDGDGFTSRVNTASVSTAEREPSSEGLLSVKRKRDEGQIVSSGAAVTHSGADSEDGAGGGVNGEAGLRRTGKRRKLALPSMPNHRPSASVRKLASEPPLVLPLLLPPPPPSVAMQPPALRVPEVKVENGPFETTRSGRVRLPRLAFWCNQSVRKDPQSGKVVAIDAGFPDCFTARPVPIVSQLPSTAVIQRQRSKQHSGGQQRASNAPEGVNSAPKPGVTMASSAASPSSGPESIPAEDNPSPCSPQQAAKRERLRKSIGRIFPSPRKANGRYVSSNHPTAGAAAAKSIPEEGVGKKLAKGAPSVKKPATTRARQAAAASKGETEAAAPAAPVGQEAQGIRGSSTAKEAQRVRRNAARREATAEIAAVAALAAMGGCAPPSSPRATPAKTKPGRKNRITDAANDAPPSKKRNRFPDHLEDGSPCKATHSATKSGSAGKSGIAGKQRNAQGRSRPTAVSSSRPHPDPGRRKRESKMRALSDIPGNVPHHAELVSNSKATPLTSVKQSVNTPAVSKPTAARGPCSQLKSSTDGSHPASTPAAVLARVRAGRATTEGPAAAAAAAGVAAAAKSVGTERANGAGQSAPPRPAPLRAGYKGGDSGVEEASAQWSIEEVSHFLRRKFYYMY